MAPNLAISSSAPTRATSYNGYEGDDTIFGGAGNDRIFDARLSGEMWIPESGYNLLKGGAGDDTIGGGTGSDTIYGGSGNDYLHLYFDGSSVLYGERGKDKLVWQERRSGWMAVAVVIGSSLRETWISEMFPMTSSSILRPLILKPTSS